MKWIKASERLPPTNFNGCMKNINIEGGTNYSNGTYEEIKSLLRHEFDLQIEWLDESEEQAGDKDKEIEKLKDLLVKYGSLEANIIGNDSMWWPNKAKDSLPDEIYNTMLELQSERNNLLKRLTPESYKNSIDI